MCAGQMWTNLGIVETFRGGSECFFIRSNFLVKRAFFKTREFGKIDLLPVTGRILKQLRRSKGHVPFALNLHVQSPLQRSSTQHINKENATETERKC